MYENQIFVYTYSSVSKLGIKDLKRKQGHNNFVHT